MKNVDYMQQSNSGNVLVFCDRMPDKAFIDAVRVKNICKVQIASRAESVTREPGMPDVKIREATGVQKYITREDLLKKFVNPNGTKIKICTLKANKTYTVMSHCSEPFKVCKLPSNCKGVIGGKGVESGSYIVIPVENGMPNRNEMGIISARLFRKMFNIPMQKVISDNLNSGSKSFGLFNRNTNRRVVRNNIYQQPNFGVNTGSSLKPSAPTQQRPAEAISLAKHDNNMSPQTKEQVKQAQALQNAANKPNYRYTAKAILTDLNNKDIGFIIVDMKTGAEIQASTVKVTQLCEKRLVNNLSLVTVGNTHRKYLRGNGIVMNNLPRVIK